MKKIKLQFGAVINAGSKTVKTILSLILHKEKNEEKSQLIRELDEMKRTQRTLSAEEFKQSFYTRSCTGKTFTENENK